MVSWYLQKLLASGVNPNKKKKKKAGSGAAEAKTKAAVGQNGENECWSASLSVKTDRFMNAFQQMENP